MTPTLRGYCVSHSSAPSLWRWTVCCNPCRKSQLPTGGRTPKSSVWLLWQMQLMARFWWEEAHGRWGGGCSWSVPSPPPHKDLKRLCDVFFSSVQQQNFRGDECINQWHSRPAGGEVEGKSMQTGWRALAVTKHWWWIAALHSHYRQIPKVIVFIPLTKWCFGFLLVACAVNTSLALIPLLARLSASHSMLD